MWALVENNSVTKSIPSPQALNIGEGDLLVKYPKNIFELWSEEELKIIGIYPVVVVMSPNRDFYIKSDPVYTFSNDVVTMTWPKSVAIPFETARESMTQRRQEELRSRLRITDGYLLRHYEIETVIPNDIITERANLRDKNTTFKTAIANASTTSDLEAIEMNWGS